MEVDVLAHCVCRCTKKRKNRKMTGREVPWREAHDPWRLALKYLKIRENLRYDRGQIGSFSKWRWQVEKGAIE